MGSKLINDFDGEFDLVGLFVGIEFDEGFDVAVHEGGAGFDKVLFLDLLAGILTPFDGLLLFVFIVVGEVEDIGALELEGAEVGDGELAAVSAFGGKDGDGFGGGSIGDRVNTSLEGFFLGAQFAQEF